jgi:hypothetical protein
MLFAARRESINVVFPWSTWPRVVIMRTFAGSGTSMKLSARKRELRSQIRSDVLGLLNPSTGVYKIFSLDSSCSQPNRMKMRSDHIALKTTALGHIRVMECPFDLIYVKQVQLIFQAASSEMLWTT